MLLLLWCGSVFGVVAGVRLLGLFGGMVWCFGTVVGVFGWVLCEVGVLEGALGLKGSNLQVP